MVFCTCFMVFVCLPIAHLKPPEEKHMEKRSFVLDYFTAEADMVVVGTNPEMVDIDNPRGEIFGFLAYVRAVDVNGYVRVFPICTKKTEEKALELAHLFIDVFLLRGIDATGWPERQPVYGTRAWVESGAEHEIISWEQ